MNCREITNRFSCREYISNYSITNKEIENILKAGICAPSGKNLKPWKFKIVKDRDIINAIVGFLPRHDWIKNSDTIIAVFLDKKDVTELKVTV